jgi:uncharacterized Ntn-hydrolase superfamily protein
LHTSTFSIVAYDRHNGDLGVAVQSKFIAVGSVVPHARAKIGAIATQAATNVSYGPKALGMLESGLNSSKVLRNLLRDDEHYQTRQIAIVDATGQVAVHTGKECMDWAGHVEGNGYSCQGNILTSSNVVKSMAKAYEVTTGDLIDKLFAALSAGQQAGGDRRGQQSAAILIVREGGGYEGFSDRYVDLRVDDSPQPIEELKRIFQVYDMTMLSREDPQSFLPITNDIAMILQHGLTRLGFYNESITGTYDEATRIALRNFVNVNNFENRMREDGKIWKSILRHIENEASRRLKGLGGSV